MKAFKNISVYIIIGALIIFVVIMLENIISVNTLSYTEFIQQLDADNVAEVKLKKNTANVKLKEPVKGAKEYKVTIYSQEVFEELMIEASRKAEDFKYSTTVREIPFWVTLLPYILMVVLFLVFVYLYESRKCRRKQSHELWKKPSQNIYDQ